MNLPLQFDANRPDVLAAGADELIDAQSCSKRCCNKAPGCCYPLGTYIQTWIQLAYSGLAAADCSPTVEPCNADVGPIHTLPNCNENGLRSRSDPGFAFVPAPAVKGFSWANGDRLYVASGTS